MEKAILKSWLLEKRPGAYATIVNTYREQALKLKPSLLINWLSIELTVEESSISYTAINSAIKRLRLKEKKDSKPRPKKTNDEFNTDIPERLGFK